MIGAAPGGAECRLTGRIRVGLPPAAAFRLFTPRGEREWVPGWEPRFPIPADDDSRPGVVFETAAHGECSTWVVLDREWGRRISYARVTPGDRAGTVTVEIREAAGGSDVDVTYELTALGGAARTRLREFAAGYPGYLRSWQEAIAASVRARDTRG